MASKVHNGPMELQHFVSVNLSSSSDAHTSIEDVHYPAPEKEEDHESVTWKMDVAGCDQVKIHYEKNNKALIVSGITAGKRSHSCKLNMSKGFELSHVMLVRIQSEKTSEMGNMSAKLVVIKVSKDREQQTKKARKRPPFWKWCK